MIDWDDAFDNSGYVNGSDKLAEKWAIEADVFRISMMALHRARLDIRYGPDPRESFDLFLPEETPKGTLVFLHGGYWLRFDKSYWSHYAKGVLANGWAVAIPSYPLAPQLTIAQITDSIARLICHIAETEDGAIALAGHSAGGHLVTRMACAGVLPESVAEHIIRVVSISGVYHLNPLLNTKLNDTLQLTQSEAMTESPVHLQPVSTIPLTFWVGDQERPEFLRQTRMIAERWTVIDAQVHSVYESDKHHFNIINSLQDKHGNLTREILRA